MLMPEAVTESLLILAGTGAVSVVPLSESPVENVKAACFVFNAFVNVVFWAVSWTVVARASPFQQRFSLLLWTMHRRSFDVFVNFKNEC